MMYFMDTFSVEETDGCKFDFIELRDGPFGYSKLIAQFCGEGFPVTIHTKTRFLWARFKSDDLVQYDGFRAVYEYKVDPGKRCLSTLCYIFKSYLKHLPMLKVVFIYTFIYIYACCFTKYVYVLTSAPKDCAGIFMGLHSILNIVHK